MNGMNNSASCQFFIMTADTSSLDGDYASFGKVLTGMEVADKVASGPSGANYILVTPVAMKSVTVDTKGIDYPKPDMLAPIQ